MDTTKEYIKMCKKAKEIQEEFECLAGDRIFDEKADSTG